ncbi:hypothetical protein IGB42_02610 [Andreprevotia sp. IGB-42]|uniref:hypothetical protein n=1 Tax=Andreprevotia sp. IGB-42 TaxID=2497473 RepID=UPI001357A39F|nr:hypothetical protein [Andreprevotia sp. IGB-42]KAF0812767.1 hypothetical protein IGB42_02610 [Andreprevotia sp. IGB-42]
MRPLHIDALRRFSYNSQLYRCFDHALAAHAGSLLAVPLVMLAGDFAQLIDRCPVPYPEALAIIETPVRPELPVRLNNGCHSRIVEDLAVLDDGQWVLQPAQISAGAAAIWLLAATSGIRMGITPDLAFVIPKREAAHV